MSIGLVDLSLMSSVRGVCVNSKQSSTELFWNISPNFGIVYQLLLRILNCWYGSVIVFTDQELLVWIGNCCYWSANVGIDKLLLLQISNSWYGLVHVGIEEQLLLEI